METLKKFGQRAVNAEMFLEAYRAVNYGNEVFPRGEPTKEMEDWALFLDMNYSPCTSFKERNFNLRYACEEFLWYLRADKFDTSIEQHAGLWKKLRQPEGFYWSNYGHYIFNDLQFYRVVRELERDPESRRAVMVLLSQEHLYDNNTDVVCTYSISFRIRQNTLNMSVNMRSNDIIFGMTNDVFCFAMIYNLMYSVLKFGTFSTLQRGRYCHKVDSLHVYSRHYTMIQNIIDEGMNGYEYIDIPEIESSNELGFIFATRLEHKDKVKDDYRFSKFLLGL